MKKIFLTVIVISVFALSAFADGHINSAGVADNCVYGHINSAGVVCEPPEGGETGHGNRAADASTITFIKTLIAQYNPFVYFLN